MPDMRANKHIPVENDLEKVPTDSVERAAWVLFRLRANRQSIASIARTRGWDRTTVHNALFRPSLPQEELLAAALGLSVPQLFPERYDEDGNRLHIVRPRRATKRKKKVAA